MTLGPGMRLTPLPRGFFVSGVNCGVRRYRPDLGLIVSDRNAVGAGVYTLNECKAAPVLHCMKLTPSNSIRAILTNSGQANAATGEPGAQANQRIVEATAKHLRCQPEQVLIASTGVIGVAIEEEKIVNSIPELIDRASDSAESFALAILTTDLIPKALSHEVELSGGKVTITGICKGSGMIHPNMATMLGYLLTDAILSPELAQALLTEATNLSFNMISVDGETSTNDCVFFLANGASEIPVEGESDVAIFKKALIQVAQALAQAIARDGEGSTKLIEVNLKGAKDDATARKVARSVIVSPLIKTAIHGEDPNWGRVLARIGAEGTCTAALDLSIQGIPVMRKGLPVLFDRQAAREQLKRDTVHISIELHGGEFGATAWGCDLSKKYVDINAEYST